MSSCIYFTKFHVNKTHDTALQIKEKDTMSLLGQKRQPQRKDPRVLVLFGQPKVGKTTVLSQLDNCLILDTEQGADYVEGHIKNINSMADLAEFANELRNTPDHGIKYLAIDTIDKIEDWTSEGLCAQHKADHIGEVGNFGAGYAFLRENMVKTLTTLKSLVPYLIIVGHRKLAAIQNKEGVDIVQPEMLDLTGKVKKAVCNNADAIGYISREADTGKLLVSFKSGEALEAGTRCDHLKGQVMPFEWSNIYVEGQSTTKEAPSVPAPQKEVSEAMAATA